MDTLEIPQITRNALLPAITVSGPNDYPLMRIHDLLLHIMHLRMEGVEFSRLEEMEERDPQLHAIVDDLFDTGCTGRVENEHYFEFARRCKNTLVTTKRQDKKSIGYVPMREHNGPEVVYVFRKLYEEGFALTSAILNREAPLAYTAALHGLCYRTLDLDFSHIPSASRFPEYGTERGSRQVLVNFIDPRPGVAKGGRDPAYCIVDDDDFRVTDFDIPHHKAPYAAAIMSAGIDVLVAEEEVEEQKWKLFRIVKEYVDEREIIPPPLVNALRKVVGGTTKEQFIHSVMSSLRGLDDMLKARETLDPELIGILDGLIPSTTKAHALAKLKDVMIQISPTRKRGEYRHNSYSSYASLFAAEGFDGMREFSFDALYPREIIQHSPRQVKLFALEMNCQRAFARLYAAHSEGDVITPEALNRRLLKTVLKKYNNNWSAVLVGFYGLNGIRFSRRQDGYSLDPRDLAEKMRLHERELYGLLKEIKMPSRQEKGKVYDLLHPDHVTLVLERVDEAFSRYITKDRIS